MSKFSKMLYMIDLLNTGNKYSITELAEKLNVSNRMIRYYKDELSDNGIFVESFKGPNGGYFLIDNVKYYVNLNKYDIDLLEYSYEILKNADFQFNDKYLELIDKLKNISDIQEEKNKYLDNIDMKNNEELITLLQKLISKKEKINISYLGVNGEIKSRTIHPLHLFSYKDNNYVTAYCELRRDIRHFELNRIKKINLNKKD